MSPSSPDWLHITTTSSAAGGWTVHWCSGVCLGAMRRRCYIGLSHSSGCAPLAALAAGSVWMWHNRWSGRYPGQLEGQKQVRQSVRGEWQAGVWLSKKKKAEVSTKYCKCVMRWTCGDLKGTLCKGECLHSWGNTPMTNSTFCAAGRSITTEFSLLQSLYLKPVLSLFK